MRPNAPESIRGVIASLIAGVLPELTTPWPQAQLRYSLGLLETIAAEWDGAVENLVHENESLQRICRVAAELAATPVGKPLARHGAALREAAVLAPPIILRVSVLSEFNNRLWEALLPVVEAVGGADETSVWAAAIKRDLQPVLHGYVKSRQFRTPV